MVTLYVYCNYYVCPSQCRSDIFVFLLSTRAGGLGINLTAADTVSNTQLASSWKLEFLWLCMYV